MRSQRVIPSAHWATLEEHGARINAAQARYLEVRRLLLIGHIDEVERTLAELDPAPFPPASRTAHERIGTGRSYSDASAEDLVGMANVIGGGCVWLTGLSGAGKSTTALALAEVLRHTARSVSVFDGDAVRVGMSRDLGFSRADRSANIARVVEHARTTVITGGIAICALISPYRADREHARSLVGRDKFLEVFVDTPLSVCEGRDPKGLYARARAGTLANFTGVNDPYEPPLAPDLVLSTTTACVEDNVQRILQLMDVSGFLV